MMFKIFGQIYFFCLLLEVAALGPGEDIGGNSLPISTYANETALRSKLQTGYDQFVRPSTPVTVNIFYSLRTLQELDITKQSMTTTGWLSLNWDDPRLVWNASDYSEIDVIETNWVWRPEFTVPNGAEGLTDAGFKNDDVRFVVFRNGKVRWIQPLHLTTTCEVLVSRFPFDSQSCYLEMAFRLSNGRNMIADVHKEIYTESYIENAEWSYDGGQVSISPVLLCCPESSMDLVYFTLNFSRLRPYYVITLLVPAMLLSVLMVLTFLLPTDCGERLGYSMTILLSYTVMMTITSQLIPTTSKETPHINTYLFTLLIICAMVVLNVVLSVKMFYLESNPPQMMQEIGRKLGSFVFLSCFKGRNSVATTKCDNQGNDEIAHDTVQELEKLGAENKSRVDPDDMIEVTWQMLSLLHDRLCLYIYTLATLILIVVFLLALTGTV